MRALTTLLEEAGIGEGRSAEDASVRRLAAKLQSERAFPAGFWHPEDADGMADVMRGCLADLGLDADVLTDELIASLVREFADLDDEDAARRHQIGAALRALNRSLAERRFHAFAEDVPGWESDEPVWILLSREEREMLLGMSVLRPPVGLERQYDEG